MKVRITETVEEIFDVEIEDGEFLSHDELAKAVEQARCEDTSDREISVTDVEWEVLP